MTDPDPTAPDSTAPDSTAPDSAAPDPTAPDSTAPDSASAAGDDDLHELVKDVAESHGELGAGAMADQLRDRVTKTEVEPEDGGDRQS